MKVDFRLGLYSPCATLGHLLEEQWANEKLSWARFNSATALSTALMGQEIVVAVQLETPNLFLRPWGGQTLFSLPLYYPQVAQVLHFLAQHPFYKLGLYGFNSAHHVLQDLRGQVITLRPKESEILAFLCGCPGYRASRTQLLEAVWGYQETLDTHTLETHIYHLRHKIEPSPRTPQLLKNDDHSYFLDMEAL